jgi:hypothetical protein
MKISGRTPVTNSAGQHADTLDQLASAARAALEGRVGQPLADEQWARSRTRLLEFGNILRNWAQVAKTRKTRTGNVLKIGE